MHCYFYRSMSHQQLCTYFVFHLQFCISYTTIFIDSLEKANDVKQRNSSTSSYTYSKKNKSYCAFPLHTILSAQSRYFPDPYLDANTVENRHTYELKNGQCTVNESVSVEADFDFNPGNKKYQDRKVMQTINLDIPHCFHELTQWKDPSRNSNCIGH